MKLFSFRNLIVLSIFILGLATSALAAETATGTTEVIANVEGAIAVEQWPSSVVTLTEGVIPGTSTVSGPFTFLVKCNSTWGIQVSSDEASGLLREADSVTGEYATSPLVMKYPLEWGINSTGPWTNLSSTPVSVYSGQPKTGDAGSSVDIYFRITGSFDDDQLPSGKEYRITLTYTAGVSY